MKKVICAIVVMVFIFCLTGCSTKASRSTIEYPFKEVHSIYDSGGNLLQQTLYNELTGEYILKEFTYVRDNGIWVCTNQTTTLFTDYPKNEDPALDIYYVGDLYNGPITIMNNEYVKVSIVKYLAADNWWEFGYELKVENKTNSVITCMIDDPYIMDIKCKPMFSIDHIEAGKVAYFTLAWDKDTLERCYIPYIDNVSFMVRVFDNDNWKTPALAGERLLIKN